jgi:hypothetical protein
MTPSMINSDLQPVMILFSRDKPFFLSGNQELMDL